MQLTSIQPNKSLKGFTLIELLVVIAIIGLLSTIIAAPIQNARKKARDAKKIAELKAVQSAIGQYAEQNSNNYPTTLEFLYPNYMPTLPSFASTTNPQTNSRDKFGYVVYQIASVTNPGATTTSGYHLGVHLEAFNVALDTDADCNDMSPISAPTATSCFKYDSTAYIAGAYRYHLSNALGGNFSSSTSVGAADFSLTGDGATSTCSGISDCVFDVIDQQ